MRRLSFLIFSLFLILLGMLPSLADAQITRTARVELTNAADVFRFGPQVYMSVDPDRQLNETVLISRHASNVRGDRLQSEVVNLGPSAAPVWMVFSVTNMSGRENWVLHFGDLTDGRAGVLNKAILRAHGEQTQLVGTLPDPAGQMSISLDLPRGQTTLFSLYMEPQAGLPVSFVPTLQTSESYAQSQNFKQLLSLSGIILFTAFCVFFGALGLVKRRWPFVFMAGYYGLCGLVFILLNEGFLVGWHFGGSFLALGFTGLMMMVAAAGRFLLGVRPEHYTEAMVLFFIAGACAAFGLAGIFIFDQGGVIQKTLLFFPALLVAGAVALLGFIQGQRGFRPACYYGMGWFLFFIGLLISGMSFGDMIAAKNWQYNAFWLALIPQSLFMVLGGLKHVDIIDEEERYLAARKNRTAQALSRLRQSKESADQARLLRIIERERELMAELRERETMRADEMRRSKDMADEANNAKSAFLAVVSHEIRTPMTGLMGMLRLLQGTKLSKDQNEYVEAIQSSGDAMMALLNDILDFEKIESGNMVLEAISFDLPRLIQGVVTLMSGHAAGKKIELRSNIEGDVPRFVLGDPTRLRQVLLNLVNNAIKFTDEGHVTLNVRVKPVRSETLRAKGDYEVYFAVEDSGIGISPEGQASLFSPFTQADSAVTRKYGGTGLGLAICKRLISAMGASIYVESKEGEGSTFFFTLLMHKGAEANNNGTDVAPEPQKPVPAKTGKHVLVVEDNELNRKVLEGFLTKDGHEVVLTASGEEALRVFESQKFDVIFSDINMPGMDGFAFLAHLRTLPGGPEVPVVALTGDVGPDDIKRYEKAGMNGFLAKPIDSDKLSEILNNLESLKVHSSSVGDEEKSTGEEAGNTGAQVFDLSMIGDLRDNLGEEMLMELIESFMEKAQELVAALVTGREHRNMDIIKSRAHELKGMAANFGMSELSAVAAQAEDAAASGDEDAARTHVDALPAAQTRAEDALKAWLDENH